MTASLSWFTFRRITSSLSKSCWFWVFLPVIVWGADNNAFVPPINTDIPPQEFKTYLAASKLAPITLEQKSAGKTYLNSLILSDSPYLIKHATNPINWQIWSSEALQKAKIENKLVFLSIGFFSCYWCQVMEKESFVDSEIAKILNRNFISVKVDRESNPELDQYMIDALQQTKGTAGWPVTALLTNDAKVVFIDSYISKQKLSSLLINMSELWQQQPQRLISQSRLFTRLLDKGQPSQVDYDIDAQLDINDVLTHLKNSIDVKNGGLLGSPKFPEATMLLFLLDHLRREPDKVIADFVKIQLKNMASKGMYDAIHGGFHRYVADDSWTIPHYEKMLYTQALMIQVYSRAYALFPEPLYEQVVQETFVFLNEFLAVPNNTFFSALDAVYQGVEGGYYLYHQKEIEALNTESGASDHLTLYVKGGLFGIHTNQASHQVMTNIRQSAKQLRDKTQLNRDDKVITSWNALLISALQSAYFAFGDEVYRSSAQRLGEALLEIQVQDDVLYRVWYKQRNDKLATLEDYAFFIRALLDLYDISFDRLWLENAGRLMIAAVQRLVDPEQGFMYSNNQKLALNSLSLKDGELMNPQAVMLENIARLNARTGQDAFKEIREITTKQLLTQITRVPLNQLYSVKVLADIARESIASVKYFANGHGRLQLKSQSDKSYLLRVTMDEHWHVNSDQPLTEDLIATQVTFPKSKDYQAWYPQPITLQFGISKTPISVFKQEFSIVVTGAQGEAHVVLQACNSEKNLCLSPEKIRIYHQ